MCLCVLSRRAFIFPENGLPVLPAVLKSAERGSGGGEKEGCCATPRLIPIIFLSFSCVT